MKNQLIILLKGGIMPVLDDLKEELYAQARAKGLPQVEAYVGAGFKADDGHASRYEASHGRIGERIKEIHGKAAELVELDVAWWLKETQSLFQRCLEDAELPTARGTLDMLGKHLGVYQRDNEQAKGMTQDEWVKHILKEREKEQ